jgi:hypothetical protein
VLLALLPRAVHAQSAQDAQANAQLGSTAQPSASATAEAQPESSKISDEEKAGLIGSPRPPGLGLAPEAPPMPPAPGGRAPSFGAPTPKEDWSFRLGGRFAGYEAFGIGRRPNPARAGYQGTALHVPALTQGRQPFWPGAGASLFFYYGTSLVNATVLYYARFSGKEREGRYYPPNGPAFGQAFLTFTPEPIGTLRLQARVGAILGTYAGPGQWGWGIFGPMLGVRGYGEAINLEYDLNPDLRLMLEHGICGVPAMPEDWARGDYTGWIETGISSYVHHGHAGLSYKNQYVVRAHYASALGYDDRTYLSLPPVDGQINAFLVEGHYTNDPYGHFGVSGAFYSFTNAIHVNDAFWWGLDWTQGGREMTSKFLGPSSQGNGKIVSVSAEYNFSLARILWYPRAFSGRSPDVRVALAGLYHRTLDTPDALFKDASGYSLGLELEYQLLSWLSATLQTYGMSRDYQTGRWETLSISPGLAFRSDWLATDRIQLAYSRHFYSRAVDFNPAAPLDKDILTVGAYVQF